MIIKPMIRNNICLNSHPEGCAKVVRNQIAYVQDKMAAAVDCTGKPKLALIIGCSTGYGLASRIAAAFGYGATTVGLSFEKEGSETKPGTPGWYNNQTFEIEARKKGLSTRTLIGDAFSDEMKAETVATLKQVAKEKGIDAKVDLIIYSLASPVRTDPKDKVMYRSVIKPIGEEYSGRTLDILTGKLGTSSAAVANEEEIAHTVKVMGGEDWELWIDALEKADVLAPNVRTIAYTYIGPKLSWGIYKNGTIGRAKEHLEASANSLNKRLAPSGGGAWVSVNKALVTRASSVIPIIPLYLATLFKVMKEKNIHEGCIEQIVRLYTERLYSADSVTNSDKIPTDNERRIRIDDREMCDDVQKETEKRMNEVNEENVQQLTDAAELKHAFLEVHGFDVAGIDYEADVNPSGIKE